MGGLASAGGTSRRAPRGAGEAGVGDSAHTAIPTTAWGHCDSSRGPSGDSEGRWRVWTVPSGGSEGCWKACMVPSGGSEGQWKAWTVPSGGREGLLESVEGPE